MKTIRFLMVTLLLVCIAAFSVTGTVMCMEKSGKPEDAMECRRIENSYLKNLRTELENQGYSNCGITMTKVTEEDLPVEYTVRIHHKRIGRLDADGKTVLKDNLTQVDFPFEDSNVLVEFYEP